MKQTLKKSALLILLLAITFVSNAQDREFYQLKIYSFENDSQVEATDSYLKEAFLPALKRQNINNIGVFKPKADSIKKIYVLIPFQSLSQFEALESQLAKDETYHKSGSAFINASYENPQYQRIESILIKAFVELPMMQPSALDGPRKDRIYELRSYESTSEAIYRNKVDMFNAGGEVALFERLKFNAVFYGEVISGPKMPNLMYMTTHANDESRSANWKNFVESSEWKELSSMDKYQNNVSHIDIDFLYPTEYSDY